MIALPAKFLDLQELADIFAIADDGERERIEGQVSLNLKRRLVDTVGPRLQEINQHLDEHQDEAACHLGSLAEATCEVALEVGWDRNSE